MLLSEDGEVYPGVGRLAWSMWVVAPSSGNISVLKKSSPSPGQPYGSLAP